MTDVQLPSVLIESAADIAATTAQIINRFPDDGESLVAYNQKIIFELYNPVGAVPTMVLVAIRVNGDTVYSSGFPQNDYTAQVTSIDASANRVTLTPPEDWDSDEDVTVEVFLSEVLLRTWTFHTLDTTAPAALSVVPQSKKVVRVTFTEPMQQDGSAIAGDALNPSLYTIDRISVPAVAVVVTSVEPVSSTEVDLILDTEMTFGGSYELVINGVLDEAGNAHAATPIAFTGFLPTWPAGRRFLLADFIPAINIAEDVTRDLHLFLACCQEVLNLLLCEVDEWGQVLDPDVAPEVFVDAMLADLGNPFTFDLDEVDKRRLLRVLVGLYKLKGTEPGMVAAILFFTGVLVTVKTYSAGGFIIGTHTLGGVAGGVLGPDQAGLYAFKIVSPSTLTDEQRTQVELIADYMKVSHEHYIGIEEPGSFVPPTHVVLGYSSLGGTGGAGTWVLNE